MPRMQSKRSKQTLPLLKRLWLRSQTKALAYTQAGSAVVLGGLDYLNGIVSDQHTKDLLNNLNVSKKVWIAIAVLAFLTWLSHGRESDA